MTKEEKSKEESEDEAEEKKYKPIELQIPLLLIRTKRGLRMLDRLGSLKITPTVGWILLIALPFIATIGMILILFSLGAFISQPLVRETARSMGPLANILIPGLNPLLPIAFGWAGLVVAIVVHEVGHGVIARSVGIRVKSMGLLLLAILPIGAFVELDDKKMAKTSLKNAGRILAAGPGNNLLAGIVSLLALILIVSSLVPVTPESGVGILEVQEGLPAEAVGLLPGDIIVGIQGRSTPTPFELSTVLSSSSAGDAIELTYARGDEILTANVELAPSDANSSRGILGVFIANDPVRTLENFRTLRITTPLSYLLLPTFGPGQTIVPYSETMGVFYTSPLGSAFVPLANLLFWIWFINLNV
ncbi:MAG: site-2 protease family protein, partial [Nitrososphaerales archaeon]